MTFILHFLLAHFLADYPLQSTRLVQLKMKRFLGVFIHGSIHLIMMVIIFFPLLYSPKVWVAIGVVYLTHNIIDQTKVQLDKKNPEKARFLYFLDQSLHWTIIGGVSLYVGDLQPHLSGKWLDFYLNQELFLYLVALVISTYFFDVSRYFILLKMKKEAYRRDYKMMAINAFVVTIAFVLSWMF